MNFNILTLIPIFYFLVIGVALLLVTLPIFFLIKRKKPYLFNRAKILNSVSLLIAIVVVVVSIVALMLHYYVIYGDNNKQKRLAQNISFPLYKLRAPETYKVGEVEYEINDAVTTTFVSKQDKTKTFVIKQTKATKIAGTEDFYITCTSGAEGPTPGGRMYTIAFNGDYLYCGEKTFVYINDFNSKVLKRSEIEQIVDSLNS